MPTAELPLRLAEFDQLFTLAQGVERPQPEHLRVRLSGGPGVAEQARDVTARESACCSFFDFDVHADGATVVVDVRVPANRVDVLDGLARRVSPGR
ncbi:hypothetical protein ACQEVB_10575 [Pseudonocardia sp. CA-107938]|uniref:hypothetical protein n=1 Tax=Pseudonocardia sp. CA-107938 TaxID=3240021 RepID=UPI003D93B693